MKWRGVKMVYRYSAIGDVRKKQKKHVKSVYCNEFQTCSEFLLHWLEGRSFFYTDGPTESENENSKI